MKKKRKKSQAVTPAALRQIPLPAWPRDASKADYGKLLIIGGSRRLPGAALLAALDAIHAQFEPCDAVVLGPGLDDDETADFIRALAPEIPLPALFDASAILALAGHESGAKQFARVWTPHGAELEVLADVKLEKIKDPSAFALHWAADNAATLVWKGAETLIASANHELWCNTAGTRGMGTAGSGDVLAGAIGALLAQGMVPAHAAVWGVYAHARAGEMAAAGLGDDGMMASDLCERLAGAVKRLRAEV